MMFITKYCSYMWYLIVGSDQSVLYSEHADSSFFHSTSSISSSSSSRDHCWEVEGESQVIGESVAQGVTSLDHRGWYTVFHRSGNGSSYSIGGRDSIGGNWGSLHHRMGVGVHHWSHSHSGGQGVHEPVLINVLREAFEREWAETTVGGNWG